MCSRESTLCQVYNPHLIAFLNACASISLAALEIIRAAASAVFERAAVGIPRVKFVMAENVNAPANISLMKIPLLIPPFRMLP